MYPSTAISPIPTFNKRLSLVEEAEQLSAKVTLPFADQPLAFLQEVWRPLPADSLVALAAEVAYSLGGQWNDTVKMNWAYVGDVRDGTHSLDWAKEKNTASYPLPGRGGIFWHGAARKIAVLARKAARGSLDELTGTASLWADLDAEKRGYSLAQGMEVLLNMPLKPSAIVFSGGGLQAVHLLDEVWSIPNREAAKEFKAHSLAFYGAPFQQAGIELDESVHDATRMMRLPGFVNRKPSRNGAVARLVWWQPDLRYSIEQIKRYAPLPAARARTEIVIPALPLPKGENGESLYRVGREFVAYLMEGETPAERHPALLRLAMQAAKTGIALEDYLIRVRPVAVKWFGSGESHRTGLELDNLSRWAYGQVADDPEATPVGSFLVSLSATGFVLASLDVIEQANTATVLVNTVTDEMLLDDTQIALATTPNVQIAVQIPPQTYRQARRTLDRDVLRQVQAAYVADYMDMPRRGFGTYSLLATSPGAGKTYTAWRAIDALALKWREEQAEDRGGAAFFSLFKYDEQGWRKYVESFGIDTAHVFYFVGRNGDPVSAGYCALHSQAEAVGKKGWIVKQTLCSRCPARVQCEDAWYLSQFNRAKNAPILLARHSHGDIEEIKELRKAVVFDESPLGVVAAAIKLGIDDLIMPRGAVLLEDQYPDEVAILEGFIAALRRVVASHSRPAKKEHLSEKYIALGGKPFFDRLIPELEAVKIDIRSVLNLPEKLLKDAARAGLRDTTPDAVAELTINFLHTLWVILKYEHETYFSREAKRWNSRIILIAGTLHLYPMQPFIFQQGVKVIITDATPNIALYGKAFAYPKTIEGVRYTMPREASVFDEQLTPLAQIVQFTGTDNSRSTIRRIRKIKRPELDITDKEGRKHAYEQELDSVALEQAKEMIRTLAEKHNGSLLVVTYKAEGEAIRAWLRQSGDAAILPENQIQWFQGLRGRNDFENLEAVLVIGTPRIPPSEVLVQAQIWHWQDDLPLDFTPAIRLEPYPGQTGKAYQYRGYADERVNQMYVHMIRAEIRQCYERIRPNASGDSPRFVYLGTAFPASDHVNEYQSWITWQIDNATEQEFEDATAEGAYLAKAGCVKRVCEKLGVSQTAARDSFERVFERWRDRLADTAYRFFDATMRTDVIGFGGAPKHTSPANKLQAVIGWLEMDVGRCDLSLRDAVEGLKEAGIVVSRVTVSRAKQVIKNKQTNTEQASGIRI